MADVELITAIKAVNRGEVYVDSSFQRYLITRAMKPEGQGKSRGSVDLTFEYGEKEHEQKTNLPLITQESATFA